MGKLKLKGAEAVVALTAAAVGGFMLGWYSKKVQYRVKRWWRGDDDGDDASSEKSD